MLVTTPETLQAILPGRRMREHLKGVRWVIVDEIHELATDERGAQLTLALERLQHLTGRAFQRIGLSATVGEEDKVGSFLVGTDRTVTIAKSEELRQFDVQVQYVPPTPEDTKDSDRFGLPPTTIARAKKIAQIISQKQSTLVFTNTREQAEAV
jgi:ATP-dependent Lhr-like helicase